VEADSHKLVIKIFRDHIKNVVFLFQKVNEFTLFTPLNNFKLINYSLI